MITIEPPNARQTPVTRRNYMACSICCLHVAKEKNFVGKTADKSHLQYGAKIQYLGMDANLTTVVRELLQFIAIRWCR